MKVQGSHTFAAPREVVWNLLMDPKVIEAVLPGVDHFAPVGPDEYDANLKIGIGAVNGQYKGHVRLSDKNPPESYKIHIKGQGARGVVQGDGRIELYDAEGGGTVLHYEGDANVGGQIASVGQRLLDSAARTLIGQGLKAMEAQIAERHEAPVELPEAAAEASATSTAETPTVPAPTPEVAPEAALANSVSESLPMAPSASVPESHAESQAEPTPAPRVQPGAPPESARRPIPARPAPPVIREPADPLTLYGGWLTATAMFVLLLIVLLRRKPE